MTSRPEIVAARTKKLEEVLQRHGITIADANDLVELQGYEMVFIADDSGSMTMSSVPKGSRVLGKDEPTRWDELCGTLQMAVELAACFDDDGVDIFFLNRPALRNVKSRDDVFLQQALSTPPFGGTPLTEVLQTVLHEYGQQTEKPVLVVIATDGVPNGGPNKFKNVIRGALRKGFGETQFKFQVLACTDDEAAIGWLNEFDTLFQEVDVTDDYYSEKKEVVAAGRCHDFKRADWIIKALLGPISTKQIHLDIRLLLFVCLAFPLSLSLFEQNIYI